MRIWSVVIALALWSGARSARAAEGFALQTFEPAPAGDSFFFVPDAKVRSGRSPAIGVTGSWGTTPFALFRDDAISPGDRIVHRQFWTWLQGSVSVADRLRLDIALPFALYQSGSQSLSYLPAVSSSGVGDLRLGARLPVATLHGVTLAAALDLWLPTGSRAAYASDGTARAQPKLLASARRGDFTVGGELGVLFRPSNDYRVTSTAPALTYAAAAAWHHGPIRVGPEIYGRYQFQEGDGTAPLEGLLGGHWEIAAQDLDLGLALGAGFNHAAGASPFRALLQAAWSPRSKAAPSAPAPVPVAAPPPASAIAENSPQVAPAPAPQRERQAPAREIEPAPAPDEGQALARRLLFEKDQGVVTPGHEPSLEAIARFLDRHPEIAHLRIEGHADDTGAAAHNQALSLRRAQAVRSWLVTHGKVEPARLEAVGLGARRPIAPPTAAGRVQNRRVEFHADQGT